MLSLLRILHALPMMTMAGMAQVDVRFSAPVGTWLRRVTEIVADSYCRVFPVELFAPGQSRTVPVI